MKPLAALAEAVMSAMVRTWPRVPGVVVSGLRPEARGALADLRGEDTFRDRPDSIFGPQAGSRLPRRGRFSAVLLFLLPLNLWAGDVVVRQHCQDKETGQFIACPEKRGISVRAYAGGLTAVATDADAAVEPLASLQVLAPLTTSKKGPSLFVKADLTALPGDTLSFDEVQTFKAIELGVGFVQPLGGPLLFSVYLEGGFASRLAVESEPVDRLPGWWSAGFLFATDDMDHSIRVGMGPDQRLSGDWSPCVHISGQAKVGERAGVSLYLVGSMIRAFDLQAYGYATPPRDSLRLGIAIGM